MTELILREDQRKIVDQIKQYFDNGVEVIALNASTGVGKSPILMSVVKELDETGFTTTPLRPLVEQYRKMITDFPESDFGWVIKGRGAYGCPHLRHNENVRFSNLSEEEQNKRFWKHEQRLKEMTADGAPCTDGGPNDGKYFVGNGKGEFGKNKQYVRECPFYSECGYYNDKKRAMMENNTVSTLDYFLYAPAKDIMEGNEWGWQPRNILVIDEAHFLSNKLVDFFSIDITEKAFPEFDYKKIIANIAERRMKMKPGEIFSRIVVEEFEKVFDEYLELQKEEKKHMEYLMDSDSLEQQEYIYRGKSMTLEEALQKHKKFIYKLNFVKKSVRPDVEFVYYSDDNGLYLKPYSAKDYVKPLWDQFDRIILSSATLFDVPNFLEDLGLGDRKWKQIDVSAPFNPENGPISKESNLYLSAKNFDNTIKTVVKRIDELLDKHPHERGIIHCFNRKYRTAIWENTANRDRMITHDSFDRQEVLKNFTTDVPEGDNTVLLSVNMGEGVDLKDDLARFQIIVKCPFLPLGDPWIKLHKERSDNWYKDQAIIELMQMAGRVVRSQEDFGFTYILDSNAWDLLMRHRQELNAHHPWFMARMDAGVRQKQNAVKQNTKKFMEDLLGD